MTAFLNHFAFEFKTGLRNASLLLMNYLFPLAFYALMGSVMAAINPTFTETMLPVFVIFTAMVSALLGMPGPLVESRNAGIYRSFKINGVPAFSILAIPALTTIFHVCIVSAVIALTGKPFFDGVLPEKWGAFVLLTLLTACSFTGIGLLIGVIAKNNNGVVLWSQLIFLPSMLIGGLMMPLEALPDSIRPFAALFPAAHAIQAFLGLAYDRPTIFDPWTSVGILAAGGLLAFGLAIYLFNWDSQNNTRRGHPLMALLAVVPFVFGLITAL